MSVLDLLARPGVFIALAALIGLVIGSFLNVVIHRLPLIMQRAWRSQCAELSSQEPPGEEALSLSRPRSRCPHCGHQITALENIPVFSYLALGGRCSACQKPIGLRYPLVEVLTALLSAAVAWRFGFGLPAAAALVFIWAMIALSGIDFDTQLLPDDITLPLLWLGLMLNLGATFVDLKSAVIGAVAGYLALWSVYWGFKLATGKEGMGYGDFKLLAAIGAWFGWQMLPLTILLSSLVGAVVGIALIVLGGRGREVPIPFGPYLAAAGVLALFFGKPLTQTYLNLL